MEQRTMIPIAFPAHLAEFGVVTAQGPRKILELLEHLRNGEAASLPEFARVALLGLPAQLDSLAVEIRNLERQLMLSHRLDPASQRLETIPGGASSRPPRLLPACRTLRSSNLAVCFAAWLGLVTRQNLSGGKERLGHVSKMATASCADCWSQAHLGYTTRPNH